MSDYFFCTSSSILIKPHCCYLHTGTTHLLMTVLKRMNLLMASPGPISDYRIACLECDSRCHSQYKFFLTRNLMNLSRFIYNTLTCVNLKKKTLTGCQSCRAAKEAHLSRTSRKIWQYLKYHCVCKISCSIGHANLVSN